MYGVSSLYLGMLAPIIPYAIKGVVWYQGESNSDRPYQYRTLLPLMIEGWRAAWGQSNFPFLIVQLPGYNRGEKPDLSIVPPPGESNWALLRESQWLTAAAVPNCGIIPTIDIGDPIDIHPKNKQEVGRRLGLAAQALAYGDAVEYSGPRLEKLTVDGTKARLTFSHVDGLAAKEKTLPGFAVSGEDHQFHWADDVLIDGHDVIISSKAVDHPVAVRYAWADFPVYNLVNHAGLPAFPFRSDDWRARPAFRNAVVNRYNAKQLRVAFAIFGEDSWDRTRPPPVSWSLAPIRCSIRRKPASSVPTCWSSTTR